MASQLPQAHLVDLISQLLSINQLPKAILKLNENVLKLSEPKTVEKVKAKKAKTSSKPKRKKSSKIAKSKRKSSKKG